MTVYHVWKPGQDEPEVVEAEEMFDVGGSLVFYAATGIPDQFQRHYGVRGSRILTREIRPSEWSRWSVVPDDASN